MVQDMFDPEFYMNVYETVDTNTKSRVSTETWVLLRERGGVEIW